jgi:hypothetical protein
VARVEWLKDEGTLAASRGASDVIVVVVVDVPMLIDSEVALVNGRGAVRWAGTSWWKESKGYEALSRSYWEANAAGAVGGPVSEERLDCAVGEVEVEIVAEGAAVLFRLDCRTPGTEVVAKVVMEDEVTGEMVVVVVVVVEGEKDFDCLRFVIPRAEAKAWVSREGPDCLGMGPGPRAFLLLEAEAEAEAMGTVSVWSRVSLALASPLGM